MPALYVMHYVDKSAQPYRAYVHGLRLPRIGVTGE
jgi:hypothetical protein